MRTTLAIDDDVMAAATEMAEKQNKSVDEIISDLVRLSLALTRPRETRNGIPLLARKPGGPVVTLELVNALRDDEP